MAAGASVSESMQVSIALQCREDHLPVTHQQKGVGHCKQVLLVMVVCGMEMCMTFEQIYQILILQYLGVPLSLVSINGVICGVTSMALIPVIGFVTDGGSNPKIRKMWSLYIGMVMFQIGLILLLISGLVKISVVQEIFQDLRTTPAFSTPMTANLSNVANEYVNELLLFNETSEYSTTHGWNYTTSTSRYETSLEAGIPITAYLAICGFAFVDIGYDTTMSVSRAYILESVPKFQHIKLLVMATIVQATSGTVFAFLGVLDISDALGHAFKVDGTSAVLIFFCVFLFVVVTSGFTSTTLTGYFLTNNRDFPHKELPVSKPAMISKIKSLERSFVRGYFSYKSEDPYTDEVDASKTPLLHDISSDNNYATMNISSSFASSNLNFDNDTPSEIVSHSHKLHRSGTRDTKGHVFGKSRRASHSETVPEIDESNFDDRSFISSQISEIKQVPDSDVAVVNTSNDIPSMQSQERHKNAGKSNVKTRLTILATATFFTVGASASFLYYAANALTIGIFHGDPSALPGTEGMDLYRGGLRTAALGNLTFYILFTITSLVNNKLLDIVGEKLLFIIFHLVFAVPLAALVTTQCIEAYFVSVVTMGVFRHTVYTLPFVMANKISQDTEETSKTETSRSNLGKIMSLIGFLIPAHYLLLSLMMGPLIEATGNVWIPLIYSLGCACASVLIFSSIFLVK